MGELRLAHEQIKQQLLQRIGRVWKPGMRVPSSPDLARQLGVGQRNTHRALAELADEGYLVARRGMGTFVNPQLDDVIAHRRAEGLLTGRRVGVLERCKFPEPFKQHMQRAVVEPLVAAGAQIDRRVVYWEKLNTYHDTFDNLDALVMINPDKSVLLTPPVDVPTVIISSSGEVRIGAAGGYDMVAADDGQGGYLAGQAMRRAGCERPCYVGCTLDRYLPTSAARLAGFEAGFGRAVEPACQLHAKAYMPASGGRTVADFLKLPQRPDGVFAASDELATGFAIGASALGLEAGRDYKLIGFDGQERCKPESDHIDMTTVLVPIEEMGRRGAELLTRRITQPDRPAQRITLSCELFAGTTCPPKEES